MSEPLIILGASSRAAAGSAIRAGYRPWCVDLFADRDTRELAAARRCPPEDYPTGLLAALDEAPLEARVLITGALENYPKVLQAIELERPLFGASAAAIERVRDPRVLMNLPKHKGLRPLTVKLLGGPAARMKQLAFGALTRHTYLRKPIRSAGGQDITWWHGGVSSDGPYYLQQYVRGQAMSAVYRADGWSALMLGASEQLIGERAFGAADFAYGGSIGPVSLSRTSREALNRLGVVLTQRYDLRGVFGIDLIMDWRGRLCPVEINPRYPASTEIVERATGLTALAPLREQPRKAKRRRHRTHGKAVVFAKQEAVAPDLYAYLSADAIADVPDVGRSIQTGKPVCTVFATEATRDRCETLLHQRARAIYEALDQP